MIYLDQAATSYPKPKEVADSMYTTVMHGGSSGRGGHQASLDASRTVYAAREKIAAFFGVNKTSRVIFTSGATESLNIVIQGLLEPGDCCVTTCMEHNSVLRPLYEMEKRGVEVKYTPVDSEGRLAYHILMNYLEQNPKMLVITHASNVTGTVNDIVLLAELCRRRNILFVVDASQTAGLLPIDMDKLGISALCFSAHKSMLGPQGVGLLCLGEGVVPRPLKYGGTGMDSLSKSMNMFLPIHLEAGTLNTPSIAGLDAACDYISAYGQKRLYEEAMELTELFMDGVRDIPGVTIHGELIGSQRTPVVAINIRDLDSAEVEDELSTRFEIGVRGGVHCAPLMHKCLETVEQGIIRFSFSHSNTKEEVEYALKALRIIEEETR